MKIKYQKLVLLIFILASFETQALNKIQTISIEGNKDTRISVFQRLILVKEGDAVDIAKINQSAQAIMDLGLFVDVTYTLKNNGDDYDLIFLVKEKYYFLVIPRLKYRNGEVHKGIQLRLENLFGLTHQLSYLYENKGSNNGVEEVRQRLKYNYPWFFDTNQTLNLSFTSENAISEQSPGIFFNNKDSNLSFASRIWFNDIGITEGIYIGIGIEIKQRDQEDINTKIISNSISSTAVILSIGNKQSHIHKYNRSGKEYEYSIETASSLIGSEITYYKHLLLYKSYYAFTSRPKDNLNVYTALGHSTNDILNDSAFTLDATNNLRGYDRERFKGNAMYIINTEYMTPSSFSPNLRYIAFVDAGTTAKNINNLFDENIKLGLGFGIRWKIPSFVKLDIRIDVGYGFEDQSILTTFGTKHVF